MDSDSTAVQTSSGYIVNLQPGAYNGDTIAETQLQFGKRGEKIMPEAFLTADNLHKSFNEHKAVNGISFTIHQSEIFGLLGPNGSG